MAEKELSFSNKDVTHNDPNVIDVFDDVSYLKNLPYDSKEIVSTEVIVETKKETGKVLGIYGFIFASPFVTDVMSAEALSVFFESPQFVFMASGVLMGGLTFKSIRNNFKLKKQIKDTYGNSIPDRMPQSKRDMIMYAWSLIPGLGRWCKGVKIIRVGDEAYYKIEDNGFLKITKFTLAQDPIKAWDNLWELETGTSAPESRVRLNELEEVYSKFEEWSSEVSTLNVELAKEAAQAYLKGDYDTFHTYSVEAIENSKILEEENESMEAVKQEIERIKKNLDTKENTP